MSTNTPKGDISKWNKIRNKSDCVTQPETPALCYPKSATTNNPFTEKLFKYRSSRGEDCNPNPTDPCVLDHTGLIFPYGVVEPVDVSVELEFVGNDLVVFLCEDFFNDNEDPNNSKDLYKYSYNGSYVTKTDIVDTIKRDIEDFINNLYTNFPANKDGKYVIELKLLRPNSETYSFNKVKSTCECAEEEYDDLSTNTCENYWIGTFTLSEDKKLITLSVNDNEGIVIVLPNTFIQYYEKGKISPQEIVAIKDMLTSNALELAKTQIKCYVGNPELIEHCPGHESFDANKSNVAYYRRYNNAEALEEYFVKETGTTHVCKNKIRDQVEPGLESTLTDDGNIKVDENGNEIMVDSRSNIKNWESIFNDVKSKALEIITSSLECIYGNKPQTSYCVYPVLRSTNPDLKNAVYGLYPGQTLSHNEELPCAIAVDRLFPLDALTVFNKGTDAFIEEDQVGNKTKNIGYIRTRSTYSDNSEYTYFNIDPVTGDYYFTEKIKENTKYLDIKVPCKYGESLKFRLWNSEYTNRLDPKHKQKPYIELVPDKLNPDDLSIPAIPGTGTTTQVSLYSVEPNDDVDSDDITDIWK